MSTAKGKFFLADPPLAQRGGGPDPSFPPLDKPNPHLTPWGGLGHEKSCRLAGPRVVPYGWRNSPQNVQKNWKYDIGGKSGRCTSKNTPKSNIFLPRPMCWVSTGTEWMHGPTIHAPLLMPLNIHIYGRREGRECRQNSANDGAGGMGCGQSPTSLQHLAHSLSPKIPLVPQWPLIKCALHVSLGANPPTELTPPHW